MVDAEIVREDEIADQIADDAEGPGRHHHRHDRQAVEAVGQVHGVGKADHGEGGEQDIEPADIQQHSLEEGEGDRGLEVRRGRRGLHPDHRQDAGDNRDDHLGQQLLFRGQPGRGLFRHLGIVVDEAQQAEGRGHPGDDPDIGIGEVTPQEDRHRDTRQDHQPAHGRGADLGQMRDRAVGADRLALALFDPHPGDETAAHGNGDDHGRGHGQRHPYRLVLDQIEQGIVLRDVGVVEIEQVEHFASLSLRARRVAA